MALLRCIECGGLVSSLAPSCPHCGCPAEFQKHQDDNNDFTKRKTVDSVPDNIIRDTKTVSQVRSLKNLDIWRNIKALSKNSKDRATKEVMALTGASSATASLFISKLSTSIGLPADLIFEYFPEQTEFVEYQDHPSNPKDATRNDKSSRHKQSYRIKDDESWNRIKELADSNRSLEAIKAVKLLTGTSEFTKAKEMVDCLRDSEQLPIQTIINKYPNQAEDYNDETGIPNVIRYPEAWKSVVAYANERNAPPAIKKIKEILNITYDVLAEEIYDEIIVSGELPVDLIAKKYPRQIIQPKTTICAACSRPISAKAETCPHCGNPTGVHICPKCGSTNTYVISRVDKAAMTFMFGRYAAHNVMARYGCEDCKYTF